MVYRVSSTSILFSYLVEFLNIKYRDIFLSWMEMFWTSGIILIPCKYYLVYMLSCHSHFFIYIYNNIIIMKLGRPVTTSIKSKNTYGRTQKIPKKSYTIK